MIDVVDVVGLTAACSAFVVTFVIAAILKKRGLVRRRLYAVDIGPYIENTIKLLKAGDKEMVFWFRAWKLSVVPAVSAFVLEIILLILRDSTNR